MSVFSNPRQGLYKLKKQGIDEIIITATISQFSAKTANNTTREIHGNAQYFPTMCLTDICLASTGERLADHCWVIVKYNTGVTLAIGKRIRCKVKIFYYDKNKIAIGHMENVEDARKKL